MHKGEPNESGDSNNKRSSRGDEKHGPTSCNYTDADLGKDSHISMSRIDHCGGNSVVRHYVNPAVYIESTVYDTAPLAPFKKCPSFDAFVAAASPRQPRIVKVKRCVCFTNPNNCPMHETMEDKFMKPERIPSKLSLLLEDTARSETDSGIRRSGSIIEDELRLSIPSLTSIQTNQTSRQQLDSSTNRPEEIFRSWCARKNEERKLQEEKEALILAIKQKQKEMQLEQERESFKRWLAVKKREEEEQRRRQQEEQDAKSMEREEQKEKRLQENELNYQLWLRRKEEEKLEKKIKEQMQLLKATEEKQKRDEYSRKAYELWLIQSKSKPKPIPLNQGFQSLRSSASVTYINPKPWVHNVDLKPKPSSQ